MCSTPDGVIGVDIKVEFLHNNEWMEVTAIGTAVRWVGSGSEYAANRAGARRCSHELERTYDV